jgi:hypothetical protein
VNLALIILRYRQPDLGRPFTVPGRLSRLPIIPAAGLLAAVGLATQFSADVYQAAAVVLIILALFAGLRRLATRR